MDNRTVRRCNARRSATAVRPAISLLAGLDEQGCRGSRRDHTAVAFGMPFFQEPPRLGNQFDDDPLLPSWIARFVPEVAGELHELGALAVQHYAMQLADRDHEPVLVQWDAWGNRVDRIEVSPPWREAQILAAKHNTVAAGYEPRHGANARTTSVRDRARPRAVARCVLVRPLAMTDGAARTPLASGNRALIDRYVPRLTSRDLAVDVDERPVDDRARRGSDVSRTETIAKPGW